MSTTNLGLPFIVAAQAQKHVTHNEALRLLDALVQLAVVDRDLNAPPGSPGEGQRWIVKASPAPTGAWAGRGDAVASWLDGAWHFSTPQTGWVAFVLDEGTLVTWSGTAWGDFFATVTALQNLSRLGVGTTADATNPLAAKLNNLLWMARTVAEGGDGHLRAKLSKESAAKTLSLLFQDNTSGRAELGLVGDDDFRIKVSPDGSAWTDALVVDNATGAAKIAAAFRMAGDISPAQVTSDQNDYNPAGLAGATVLRLTSDASRKLTGLAGGSDGRVIVLINAGSSLLTLGDEHASSTAGYRFALGRDLTLLPKQSVTLWYDDTSARWRILARSPTEIAFSAHKNNTDQTAIPAGVYTKLTFGTERFDAGGYYDASTSKFIPPAGKYRVTISILMSGGLVDQASRIASIYRNGSQVNAAALSNSGTANQQVVVSAIVDCNGSDEIEAYFYADGAGAKTVHGQSSYTYFEAEAV